MDIIDTRGMATELVACFRKFSTISDDCLEDMAHKIASDHIYKALILGTKCRDPLTSAVIQIDGPALRIDSNGLTVKHKRLESANDQPVIVTASILNWTRLIGRIEASSDPIRAYDSVISSGGPSAICLRCVSRDWFASAFELAVSGADE